jgi:hypothetical protein
VLILDIVEKAHDFGSEYAVGSGRNAAWDKLPVSGYTVRPMELDNVASELLIKRSPVRIQPGE